MEICETNPFFFFFVVDQLTHVVLYSSDTYTKEVHSQDFA